MGAKTKKRMVVVDGLAYAYRSFYAIRDMANSKGRSTNAIHGFLRALIKAEKDFSPDFAVVAFDAPGPTFRDKLLAQYKAQRQPMPEPLRQQLPEILALVPHCGWHLLSQPGFEADDIMATLAEMASGRGLETVLMSSDKDLLQLIRPGLRVYRESPQGGSLYGPDEVKKRFGVLPCQIPDLLALMGDASDNIPGVPGVGEKTAAELLAGHPNLEKVLASAAGVSKPKLRENLVKFADQARASRELALLVKEVPLGRALDDLRAGRPDFKALLPMLKDLELKQLWAEYAAQAGEGEAAPPAGEAKAPVPRAPRRPAPRLVSVEDEAGLLKELARGWNPEKPAGLALYPESAPSSLVLAQGSRALAFPPEAWPRKAKEGPASFRRLALFRFKPLQAALLKRGLPAPGPGMDVEIAGYLLDSNRPWRNLPEAAGALGLPQEGLESPQQESLFADPAALAARALALADMEPPLASRLEKEALDGLYRDLEAPLSAVLAGMEQRGVKLDVGVLEELEQEAQKGMRSLAAKALKAAGREFNLNSPAQLAEVLFKDLGMPPQRKTKTGYSTDNEVLEFLAPMHALPALVLEYRALAKLSGTYLQALPRMIDPADGRLHCAWNQSVAATGRLSSSDPNLQNIPIRTELGRRVRLAFVAERKGDLILSADYSQIELRLLAHFCGDEALTEAFRKGQDIHARTAARVLGVAESKVTEDMRRRAKVINFGILYGMSAFGLSRELGIPQGEARAFIQAYFAQFPKVSAYLESCKEQARAKGFVTTLLGRRRAIPEIHSANKALREFAERTAVNTPIQGSAADLIKRAMLEVEELLKAKKCRSRVLMQVHDELVFELAAEEQTWLPAAVGKAMEECVKLKIPLKVSLGTGKSWYDAKS